MTRKQAIQTARILKDAREKSGLLQAEVAKKAGIHPNTYAKIERAEQVPTFDTIKKLAKALNIHLDTLQD